MSLHKCGKPVKYVMPKEMAIGNIPVDLVPDPDGDVWVTSGCQDFEWETWAGNPAARRYRRHTCQA